jgi:hypothetical protein
MPRFSPRTDQRVKPTFPLHATPAPVKVCPIKVALLPVIAAVLALVLVVPAVLVVELAPSVPPSPLQIMLPTFTCAEVVATVAELVAVAVVELAPAGMVVFESVIVELPTTRKSLFEARLTGVPRIVTDEEPALSVVPAMTIGWVGNTTTGRLYGPVIVAVATTTVLLAMEWKVVVVEEAVVNGGVETGAGERSYVDGLGPPAVGLRGAMTSCVPLGPRERSVLLETRMA